MADERTVEERAEALYSASPWNARNRSWSETNQAVRDAWINKVTQAGAEKES